MRRSYKMLDDRVRPTIKLNGIIETLIDPGADLSVSILSRDFFAGNYNIVGERRKDDAKSANSPMPGLIIVLEEFSIGDITIVGMPILLPDNSIIKSPLALVADVFYCCGMDYTISNSTREFIITAPDDILKRKYIPV